MALTRVLLTISSLLVASAASQSQTCADEPTLQRGSLIQVQKKQQPMAVGGNPLDWNRIPAEVRQVGVSLFGSEANVMNILNNSQVMTISYANVTMEVVMGKTDDAVNRYGPGRENGDEYGLDAFLSTLGAGNMSKTDFIEARRAQNQMINMIDVGGHLGIVSIAMYMKYPQLVRAVVLEPLPTSQFYLHLNLYLNGVPHLVTGNFGKPQPGIGAIQRAAANQSNLKVDLCTQFHEQWTGAMNSFQIRPEKPCNCSKDICSSVMTMSVDDLFAVFGNEDVSLLKLDCEECERDFLPAMAAKHATRVKQLSGELHMMTPQVVDIACRYNYGFYLNGMCQKSVEKNGTIHLYGKTFCDTCSSAGQGNVTQLR